VKEYFSLENPVLRFQNENNSFSDHWRNISFIDDNESSYFSETPVGFILICKASYPIQFTIEGHIVNNIQIKIIFPL
jgi:hypothetical protein